MWGEESQIFGLLDIWLRAEAEVESR